MQPQRVARRASREIVVAVWNRSRRLPESRIKEVVKGALQTQVTRDLYPAWGTNARLEFTPRDSRPASGRWRLILLDDRHDALEAGFHDLTNEGLPQGLVFVEEQKAIDRKEADLWTLSASHELLEMLADPDLNHAAATRLPDIKRMLRAIASGHPFPESDEVFCALEICDPCGAAEYGYRIDRGLVSDFVYPAWFQSFRRGAKLKNERIRFDHGRYIESPFQALRGGYAILYGDGEWRLHAPSGDAAAMDEHTRTRRERRVTLRDQWKRSRQ